MRNVSALTQPAEHIRGLENSEVEAALRRHNPKLPRTDLRDMAKIVTLIVDFVAGMPIAELRKLARENERFRAALEVATYQGKAPATQRDYIEASGRTIRSRGTGLGKQIPIEEGRARLIDYARTGKIDSWAGPVAGAGEIER